MLFDYVFCGFLVFCLGVYVLVYMVQNRIICHVVVFGLIRMCLGSYGMCWELLWSCLVWYGLVRFSSVVSFYKPLKIFVL